MPLPDLAASQSRDLFNHRSGLSGNAGNDLEGLGFTRSDIVHQLRYLKPASSFRSAYTYSNFGLTEGALAAARAIGLDWEDAARASCTRRSACVRPPRGTTIS